MRVINDKEDSSRQSEGMGLLAVPFYSMMCGLGISTLLLSPMTILLAHLRLTGFWPKLTAILGALAALILLEAPLSVVLLSFVFGLFVADSVDREVPLTMLFFQSLLLASVLGVLGLAVLAPTQNLAFSEVWPSLVDQFISQVKTVGTFSATVEWDLLRGILLYEGPFLYLSGAIFSLWLSVGFAAHLGWFSKEHAYHADKLRGLSFPKWTTLLFVVLFLGSLSNNLEWKHWFGGFLRISSAFMFVQGCVQISRLLELRKATKNVRAIVYSLSVILGFYAVVSLGVLAPWIRNRKSLQPALKEGV